MRNLKLSEQGFTLIGVMIIAAMLAVIAGLGMYYSNFNARKIEANLQVTHDAALITNVDGASTQEGSINKTESLEFPPTPTPPSP